MRTNLEQLLIIGKSKGYGQIERHLSPPPPPPPTKKSSGRAEGK